VHEDFVWLYMCLSVCGCMVLGLSKNLLPISYPSVCVSLCKCIFVMIKCKHHTVQHSTIVQYSNDHKGVGVAHETSPKNQLQSSSDNDGGGGKLSDGPKMS